MTTSSGMSMFDYDARPVTPQVVLIGNRSSSAGYSIRDFLSRNGVPYEWVDAGDASRVEAILPEGERNLGSLPVCVLPDGGRLAPATLEAVAAGLGMVTAPSLSEYDLTIVGAGPAGLAAAVYAASEGLNAVTIEAIAPGGQAGTTSMIENYLGFPQGISGSELATRATSQARRFGAEILLARRLADVTRDGPGYVAQLSDGTTLRSCARTCHGERGRLASPRRSRHRRTSRLGCVLRRRAQRGRHLRWVSHRDRWWRKLGRPGRDPFLALTR